MAHSQSSRRTPFFGLLPSPGCLVASRLLVVLAALFQFIPNGFASSQAFAAVSGFETDVSESLTANTHAVELGVTQPTHATRLAVKSSDAEPLQTGWGTLGCALTIPASLCFCGQRCTVEGDSYCLVTLVELNVRLQI